MAPTARGHAMRSGELSPAAAAALVSRRPAECPLVKCQPESLLGRSLLTVGWDLPKPLNQRGRLVEPTFYSPVLVPRFLRWTPRRTTSPPGSRDADKHRHRGDPNQGYGNHRRPARGRARSWPQGRPPPKARRRAGRPGTTALRRRRENAAADLRPVGRPAHHHLRASHPNRERQTTRHYFHGPADRRSHRPS